MNTVKLLETQQLTSESRISFPLFQNREIGHFSALNRISKKLLVTGH